MNITFSTISGNAAGLATGDRHRGGGGVNNFGEVNIGNTILAGNTDDNPLRPFDPPHSGFSPDCSTVLVTGNLTENFGTFRSFGGNVVGLINKNCRWDDRRLDQVGEPSRAGDELGTFEDGLDPLLGPLDYNGGPTQTHALEAGSPARDRAIGEPDGPGFFDCPSTDQRGVPRPQLVACDFGAFEVAQ